MDVVLVGVVALITWMPRGLPDGAVIAIPHRRHHLPEVQSVPLAC